MESKKIENSFCGFGFDGSFKSGMSLEKLKFPYSHGFVSKFLDGPDLIEPTPLLLGTLMLFPQKMVVLNE